MPILTTHGARVSYSRTGTGEAVLLIQGVGAIGNAWRPQIEALSQHYSVIAFDNRGIGGSSITEGCLTIEGMAEGSELHPLQDTFADLGAAQCGYCSPGFLLVAKELIEKSPKPSRDEIKEALSGNLCRCTGYIKIYEAVELAAARMRGEPMELPRESLYGLE